MVKRTHTAEPLRRQITCGPWGSRREVQRDVLLRLAAERERHLVAERRDHERGEPRARRGGRGRGSTRWYQRGAAGRRCGAGLVVDVHGSLSGRGCQRSEAPPGWVGMQSTRVTGSHEPVKVTCAAAYCVDAPGRYTRDRCRQARRRRVLHVAHYCLPHIGGLENVVAAETRGLAARGWEVALVSSAGDGRPGRARRGRRPHRPGAGVERAGDAVRGAVPGVLPLAAGRPVPGGAAGRPRTHPRPALPDQLGRGDVVLLLRRRMSCTGTSASCTTPRSSYGWCSGWCSAASPGSCSRRAAAILPIDEYIAGGDRGDACASAGASVLGNGVDTSLFRPARPRRARRTRRSSGCRPTGRSSSSSGASCRRRASPTVAAAAERRLRDVFVGGDRPPGSGRPAPALPRRAACRRDARRSTGAPT